MIEEKIKTQKEIKKIVKDLRKNNSEIDIATTNGSFDILHSGHAKSLEKAKSYGDILIVGLNSDSSIKKYKSSKRPIISQEYRATLLAALEMVDYVVIFEETDPRKLLKKIKPDYHIKSKSGFKGIERKTVENNGGQIKLIDDFPGISTTQIIQSIKERYKIDN